MKNYDAVWEAVLSIIKEKTTPVCYETWFRTPLSIKKIDVDLNIIYLDIQTNMDIDFFMDIINNRYLSLLQEGFEEILGEKYRVVLKSPLDDKEEKEKEEKSKSNKEKSKASDSKNQKNKNTLILEHYLNPKYTFDNFVVGPCNSFAQAAALAVAESPGIASNPLFIYGGPGLGKTHLIHAIGIYILENNPSAKVLYTSSENFTNEFIIALKNNKTNEFKSKYRKVDVLIVDDIQFLEGKVQIQEEFFNTFNSLFQNNKQIILSSDRAPNELSGINDRLTNRFMWNLMADIQPADYETRVAILLKLAENANLVIDEDFREAINYIAERFTDNIRELEGAFSRLFFYFTTFNEKPSVAVAKKVIKEKRINDEQVITPEKIKRIVCKHNNIKLADIESSKRTNNIAYPRQIAMYLIREMTDSSLPKIGDMFGGRDHTTVKYACEKIAGQIKMDESFRTFIDELISEIRDS